MKYWRIKTGYGVDNFISIDETELAKALRAQITGRVGLFKDGTITGKSIISITPDYNKMMGYNRDYALVAEDYERIGQDRIEEHRMFIESVKNEVLSIPMSDSKLLLE